MSNYSRVYAEVNLDILRHNVLEIKKEIGNRKILAVVKADAYGHGAITCAKNIDDLVDFYGVATLDEALDLKSNFIEKPILVLGAIFDEKIADAINSQIRITVYDVDLAIKLSQYSTLINKKCYIHIKLDTGMSRLGFRNSDDLFEYIKQIHSLPNIVVEGIFTHFANADEKDESLTLDQMEIFESVINECKANGISFPIVHCANSSGINCFPQSYNDMVRAGLIMYGYYPCEDMDKNIDVQPIITLKSHIISIKNIPKGTGVSYNWKYITDRDTKVAVVPVGYADGYPRSLTNKGYVLVNGKRSNIIGAVCMDQFVIDVTEIDVKVGDGVVLIGKDGEEEIRLVELSNISGKFIYEFICGLSKRIPRIYVRNNKIIDEINYFYTNRRI